MFEPVAHHHATITALRDIHRELRHVPRAAMDRFQVAVDYARRAEELAGKAAAVARGRRKRTGGGAAKGTE